MPLLFYTLNQDIDCLDCDFFRALDDHAYDSAIDIPVGAGGIVGKWDHEVEMNANGMKKGGMKKADIP